MKKLTQRDPFLYSQAQRRYRNGRNLSTWRQDMKTIEDEPDMCSMYDSIGRENKTMVRNK